MKINNKKRYIAINNEKFPTEDISWESRFFFTYDRKKQKKEMLFVRRWVNITKQHHGIPQSAGLRVIWGENSKVMGYERCEKDRFLIYEAKYR